MGSMYASPYRMLKMMNKFQEILKNWETPMQKSTEDAWQDIQPKLQASRMEARVIGFSWKPMISVAAAAAVIVAVVMFWPSAELVQHVTAQGKTLDITLPDQSIAHLNASSSMSYSDDWSKERTLSLEGEAFFEVQKGSKFSVVTSDGIVEVLGTSFDVTARKGQFRVECRTGKVKVSLKSGKSEVEITPGKAAVMEGKLLSINDFDLNRQDWRKGEFHFDDVEVEHVFEELARQFNVQVEMKFESGRRYTGSFKNSQSLDTVLKLVCIPMGFDYEIRNGNQIIITQKGR
jgi:transmembrane sensor